MNEIERVVSAFNHKEPDRTPFFERLIKPPALNAILGREPLLHNFKKEMEYYEQGDVRGLLERHAEDIADMTCNLDFDILCISMNRTFDMEDKPVKVQENQWKWGDNIVTYLEESDVVLYENVKDKNMTEDEKEKRWLEELEKDYVKPEIKEEQFFVWNKVMEILKQRGKQVAIYCSCYSIGVSWLPAYMFTSFYTNPERIHRMYEKATQGCIATGKEYVKRGAHIIGLGGDFGSDMGPMISPGHYKEFVMPYIKKQSDAFHALGAFTTNTSDGDLWSVLDYFLTGAGVDGYGEIDKAAGMDLGKLKKQYGDRITFLGNVDIRFTLCQKTPKESYDETIQCLKDGWGNGVGTTAGGHILMTSNCVHKDVKPENYLAMVRAYRKYFNI